MNTKTLPRPSRRPSWNDRVMLTIDGKQTADALNTNICPRCGCTNLREGYCDCTEPDEDAPLPIVVTCAGLGLSWPGTPSSL